MLRFLVGVLFGFVVGIQVASAPAASADPGGCSAGAAPFSRWAVCDYNWQPDGAHTHCDAVFVFGFGGWNCYPVLPPVEQVA